jgi:hypothetical protein
MRKLSWCCPSSIVVGFKLFQYQLEFGKVTQIEKRIEHIVHAFNIVTCFHCNHQRFIVKQVDPFLRIAIVHQKILPYKSKPAVTLVEIKLFIEILRFEVSGNVFCLKKSRSLFHPFHSAHDHSPHTSGTAAVQD